MAESEYCGHESAAEKETILRFSEDPCEPLTIFTFRKHLAERLMKAGAKLIKTGIRRGTQKDTIIKNWTIEVPREWFREPRPRRKRPGTGFAKTK